MQVVIHAGAHMTDEDRLIECLSTNREMLEEQGTNVPAPASYRKLIRDVLQAAQKTRIVDETRDVLLDAILQSDARDRMILSNEGFFGTPKMAVSSGVLYGAAEQRLNYLQRIFRHDHLELFLAICNPATFVPALFGKTPFERIDDFLRGVDPRIIRWSEMISRLRESFPDLPITVWCNEDLPLIWSQVIREMAGLAPTDGFTGEFSFLSEIMTEAGMKRFNAYVSAHPGMSETQKRRVIAAFLDKFAREDAIEEELDVPGWTDELIEELTDLYDDDLYAIQRVPGINLITP